MYKNLHTHFVGIGGIGMSGIAEVLLNLGYPVSGSDVRRSDTTKRLQRLGAKVHIGHAAKNLKQADVLVVSSAIRANNPEVLEAKKRQIRIIRRAEMLAQIMRLTKYGIAVAGTHGKTTTTSLIAHVLHAGHVDPTVIIGGELKSLKTNSKLGKGDFMLAEADESDGSFLQLFPSIVVVTNIDREHMDHYGNFAKYREAFLTFCNQVPFYGLSVLCGEDQETASLASAIKAHHVLYGFAQKHDVNAQNISHDGIKTAYDLYHKTEFITRVDLNLAGRHNVLNSLAAIAVAEEIGVKLEQIKEGLKEFPGVGRRLEILCQTPAFTAIDDYGHHPTEIQATLAAVRQAFAGRLVVLFQPHRYTRTKDLFPEFVKSFTLADKLYVTGIYPGGEAPIPGVSGQRLAQAIHRRHSNKATYVPATKKMVTFIANAMQPGDVFLSLGAGDVTKWGHKIAGEICGKNHEKG